MAGVAIRQIVSALFERVSKSTEEEAGQGEGQGEEQQMPSHTRDAYLLFQVIINLLFHICTCTTHVAVLQCMYLIKLYSL